MDGIRMHELKIRPDFFTPVWNGTKGFEVRRNDRDYRVGDWLDLKEWTEGGGYTGRHVKVRVDYKLPSDRAMGMVADGCAVLGISNPFPGRVCPYCGFPIIWKTVYDLVDYECEKCGRGWMGARE